MGAKKIDWLNDPDVEQYWTIYQFNRLWVYTMWPTNASFLFIIMKQLWTYLAHLEVTCLTSLFYFLVHMNYFISHSFMSIPIFWLLFFCTKLKIQTSVYLTLITMCFSTPTSKQKQSWQSLPWEKKEEKYGVNYRSYFRNNLPLKKDRILISKLFSQIINLQWILQVKINPAKYEWHCNWKRKGFDLNLDVPF